MRPRSASAIGLWRVSWMNASADYGLRRRRGRRGWRRTRSTGAYGSLRRGSGSSRGGAHAGHDGRSDTACGPGAVGGYPEPRRPGVALRWTAKSVRRLRDELRTGGHRVSHETVVRLLRGRGYSLQANRKVREGTAHPDRDAQFQHLNTTATRALDAGEPVISVDTTKKELVGDCKHGGREWEWRHKGSPEPVRVYDAEGPRARQGDSLVLRQSPATGAANRSPSLRRSST